jgi:hypothetical protein
MMRVPYDYDLDIGKYTMISLIAALLFAESFALLLLKPQRRDNDDQNDHSISQNTQ